jgi:Fe-S cluster assembly ATP-binding protein
MIENQESSMLELKDVIWDADDGERIINGVSFKVPDRKLVVITGPNGGGKTTIAKLIAGIIRPTSGKLVFDGQVITDMSITDRARNGISYSFQQPVRFKGVTVRDLLNLAAGKELTDHALCNLLGTVGLCTADYVDREINQSLSGGEIKRIEIASVLARRSKMMVFDEPEAGIDLWSFTQLVQVFETIKQKEDASLLIISHQERIIDIADEIIVISDGKVAGQGPKEEILPTLMLKGYNDSCDIKKMRNVI